MAVAVAMWCGCRTPTPGDNAPVTVSGSPVLAWTQGAPDVATVRQYAFAVYVDDARSPLTGPACQNGSAAGAFTCSAGLPQIVAGIHRLELTAVGPGGLESARSAPLYLNAVSTTTPADGPSASVDAATVSPAIKTADGVGLAVQVLAHAFDRPSALAVAPDRRVFVADRGGDVWLWDAGRVDREPALRLPDIAPGAEVGLLGLALDPNFSASRLVYLLYTARLPDGSLVNRVMRYRELNGTLGERIVIMESPTTDLPERTPRVRVGSDHKLYVAFSSGADRTLADTGSAYAGKILRINDDGTTPRDNLGSSPIVSEGFRSPAAFDWQPSTGALWISQRDWDGRDTARELQLAVRGGPANATRQAPYTFESPVDPAGAAFYSSDRIPGLKGNLLVAALSGRHLRRVQFDPSDSGRIVFTERLFDQALGRLADIVVGPDGDLYVCTNGRTTASGVADDELLRVTPDTMPDAPGSIGLR